MTVNLRNIYPTKAIDVVTVLTNRFIPAFPLASPSNASVVVSSTQMSHPLEDSTTVTDHVVFNPTEISMQIFAPSTYYRITYQRINAVYLAQENLTIQLRSSSYENMVIQSISHVESPEVFDSLIIQIKFKETQFSVASESFVPAEEIDSNTIDRGQIEPSAAPDQSSLLGRIARALSS